MTKTWRLIVPAVALVAAMFLTACPPKPAAVRNAFSVVVADSIGFGIKPGNGIGYVDASGSRTAYSPGRNSPLSGVQATRTLSPIIQAKRWVIIELGANDISNAPGPDRYQNRVRDLIDSTVPDECVAMVTVYRPAYGARAKMWNDAVAKLLPTMRRGCWRIINWALAVQRYPWLIASDQLHPTQAGTNWLQLMYIQTAQNPGKNFGLS